MNPNQNNPNQSWLAKPPSDTNSQLPPNHKMPVLGVIFLFLPALFAALNAFMFYASDQFEIFSNTSVFAGILRFFCIEPRNSIEYPGYGIIWISGAIFLFFFAAAFLNTRLRCLILNNDAVGTWLLATIFFLVPLVTRIAIFFLIPDLTWGGSVVSGVPYSDAQCWFSEGISFYEGHGMSGGWSARRPFYAILMASVFTWTGPSYMAAVLTNIILSSAAISGIYLICDKLFNRLVAIATALFMAHKYMFVMCSLVALSEVSGIFFSVWGIWFIILAAESGSIRNGFLSGLAFGLENITRTISLLALPFLALILAWLRHLKGCSWKRSMLLGSVFILGVTLSVGPWLVRQKIVHDIVAIGDNTAETLYAAASPKWKTWKDGVHHEADAMGVSRDIKERYDHFNSAFVELLRENWLFYLKNVFTSFCHFLYGVCPKPISQDVLPFTLFLCGLLVFVSSRGTSTNFWLILALFATLHLCCGKIPKEFNVLVIPILLVSGLFLLKKESHLLLVTVFISAGLGASMVSLGGHPRMTLSVVWIPIAFFYALLIKAYEKLFGHGAFLGQNKLISSSTAIDSSCRNSLNRSFNIWRTILTVTCILVLAFLFAGMARLAWKNCISSPQKVSTFSFHRANHTGHLETTRTVEK